MSSKLSKPSLIQSIAKRSYGAQAAAAVREVPSYTLSQREPEVTALPTGNTVISIDNNTPVAKLAVLFRAGSRYESVSNAGVSHALRRCVGLTTNNMSAFGLLRETQQNGATLTVDCGREVFSYGFSIIRDNVDVGLNILREITTQQIFKPWEIARVGPFMKLDSFLRDDTVLAMENVHRAAYRSTLGNSLYMPSHRIPSFNIDEMKSFISETHTLGSMAVVGAGVDHDVLLKFTQSLEIESGKGSPPSKYSGGEVRTETGSDLAHVVVCGSGASIGNEALAFAVAQYAIGVNTNVKYGTNQSNKLVTAIKEKSGLASAVNMNYSDGGLFGYMVVADADDAGEVVKVVHSTMKNMNLSAADVEIGKKKLKSSLLILSESQDSTMQDLSTQALLTGAYVKPSDLLKQIDQVNASSVNSAIKKAFGGKLTMGAAGGLKTVPYLDEL